MKYATIKDNDISNGPGVRVSLYVSGCTNHCDECFNPETWDFNYGEEFNATTMEMILQMIDKPQITGFTLLGGDPLHPNNIQTSAYILQMVREKYPDLSIWVYSGYTFNQLLHEYTLSANLSNYTAFNCIIKTADVLVDGKFDKNLKDLNLKFRGSSNQRIINLKETHYMYNPVIIHDDELF